MKYIFLLLFVAFSLPVEAQNQPDPMESMWPIYEAGLGFMESLILFLAQFPLIILYQTVVKKRKKKEELEMDKERRLENLENDLKNLREKERRREIKRLDDMPPRIIGTYKGLKILGKYYQGRPCIQTGEIYFDLLSLSKRIYKLENSGNPLSKYYQAEKYGEIKERKWFKTISEEEAIKFIVAEEKVDRISIHDGPDGIIEVRNGRFGPYIRFNNDIVSIPKDMDPVSLSLGDCLKLIEEYRIQKKKSVIAIYDGPDGIIEVRNGRFRPYIRFNKRPFKVPEDTDPSSLSIEDCLKAIEKGIEERRIREKKNEIAIHDSPDGIIEVRNAASGPYIRFNKTRFKVPEDIDPSSLSLEDCLRIIQESPEPLRSTLPETPRPKIYDN